MNNDEQLEFLINYLLDERSESIDIPKTFSEKRNLLRSLMNMRRPSNISEEFLRIQDEFLSRETANKNLTSVEDISLSSGKIMLWQGDITTLSADAIVNAANSKLLGCFIPMHNCIDNIIHSASGLQLREECNRMIMLQGGDEDVGKAKITNAYNLPSKYVVHTVGPSIERGMRVSSDDVKKLESCYHSCLELASEYKLNSIAFCCISTGVFNFPQKKAAEIAIRTVKDFLNSNETSLNHVIFDVFTDKDYDIYKKLLFGN